MEHLSRKYGAAAVARFGKPGNPLDVAGSKVGITFNPSRRIIPTMICHRAIEWCNDKYKDHAKTDAFMESLFIAYFTNGLDVSSLDQVVACAEEVEGIDANELKTKLETSGSYSSDVEEKIKHFQEGLRISGVPFFIVEGKEGQKPITFSGAQPVDVIAEQLQSMYE